MKRFPSNFARGFIALCLALGAVGCSGYKGPSIRLSAGYNGAELGITIFERTDPLGTAADRLATLTTPESADTAKNPVLP